MEGYLRLGDLGRPLQDNLGKETNKKEWPCKQNPEEKEFHTEEMAVEEMVCCWKNNKASLAGYQWAEGE